jgi:PAS domain S-box-containing protein
MWDVKPDLLAKGQDEALMQYLAGQVNDASSFLNRVQFLYQNREETSRAELPLKDGRTFDRYSAAMFSPDGHYYGRVWYFRDITEAKRAEERLREQAALLDAANDAIYVHDLNRTVLYWNRAAEQLYGWSSAEMLGHKLPGFLEPEMVPGDAFKTLLTKDSWSGEHACSNNQGKSLVVFSRWTLLRDKVGNPNKVLSICSDLSEKKQLEAKFLRAQRLEAVGALASGIAHDLNNILAPVMMTAPLLRETTQNPESRAMLEMMESCARRGADIIRQLLTFARGTPGARGPLSIRHLLRDVEKIIAETFPRDIRATVETAKDLWPLVGDATRVHQTLMNLCVNSRDAMPDGGILKMTAGNVTIDNTFAAMVPEAKPGRYVCVTISDNGTGISPENLKHIFEPFFTTKGEDKGTGLGLATLASIVRAHEGFIQLSSELGHGATFSLYFPASPVAGPEILEPKTKAPPRGQGELILIVDDEPNVLGALTRTLEASGYRVVTARQGAEAVATFTLQKEIRAVITDMMMPGMYGPALVEALRCLNPRIPILGMSGSLDRTEIKGIERIDCGVILAKPFSGEQLLRSLHPLIAST